MKRLTPCLLLATLLLTGFRHQDARIYVELAQMYSSRGDNDTALTLYDRAISLEPQNRDLYVARGFFLLKQNRLDPALADLSTVITLQPDKADGYLSRGLVYLQHDKADLARADFSKACQLGDTSGCQFLKEE
jgi:Tfp pilus assembly protein PilF